MQGNIRDLTELFDAFDLKRVARDRAPQATAEWNNSNDFYGIAGTLKAFAGLPATYALAGTVSHGHFMEFAWDVELNAPLPVMFGMDQPYARYLEGRSRKLHLAVGPYLHYARAPYTAQQGAELKAALGKTLLIMPPHSTHHVEARFEHACLLRQIAPLRQHFDTLLVTIYWKDALTGWAETYAKAGLTPVCAGHMYDNGFLARLRGVMDLADAAFFMGRGSQIPFWMSLNKPLLFAQPGEKLQLVASQGHGSDLARPGALRDAFVDRLQRDFGQAGPQWPDNWSDQALLPYADSCGLNSLRQPWELRTLFLLAEALRQSWQPGSPLPLAEVAEAFAAEARHAEAALLHKELRLRRGEQWREQEEESLSRLCPARPGLALNPDPAWNLSDYWASMGLTQSKAPTRYPLEWGHVPLPDASARVLLLNAADAGRPELLPALRDAARVVQGPVLCPLPAACAALPPALRELALAVGQKGADSLFQERLRRSCQLANVAFEPALMLLHGAALLHKAGMSKLTLCTDFTQLPQEAAQFLQGHDFCCIQSLVDKTRD